MTNILPIEEKNHIAQLYNSRTIALAGLTLLASAVLVMFGLLPAIVVLQYEKIRVSNMTTQSSPIHSSPEEQDAVRMISTLSEPLARGATAPVASDVILHMLSFKPQHVSITHIVLSGHSLIVNGVASSSEATVFANALHNDPAFKSTSAPATSLVGSIQAFTITIPDAL